MKKNIFSLSTLLILALVSLKGFAQVDPHFTQYYIYPSWTNSALTGAFDGSYRVSGIFRTQWGNISAPYSTQGLAADFTTDKNLNYGVSLINQTAGNGGYRYNTVYGNIAYTGLRFGANERHRVVFGMQAGLIQRSFDVNRLDFLSEYNPITGLPDKPSGEILQSPRTSTFDAAAGVMYFDGATNRKTNVFVGYSASHLTRPKDKFNGNGPNAKIPMRHLFHGGMKIKVNNLLSITPNALYMRQGTAQEIAFGFYSQYKIAAETDLMTGANYRINDAMSPFLGFSHKKFVLGLSYDINTSDLSKLAKGSNSFEISLSISGRKSLKTPEVEFVCPRL
jgi:type IX secretion system PorP/SprF family membrane protein